MKRLIYYLFSLLGFGAVSCDGLEGGGNLDAYGPGWVGYRVSGRVVDAEGNPIYGIIISNGDSQENSDGFTMVGATDREGAYVVYIDSEYLRFKDVDGEANGGEFEEQYIQVTSQHSTTLDDVVLRKVETGDNQLNEE